MDSRLIKSKALMKPLLLKDYLLDDVSSCSSNGFKSFPRRQCCTSTVRFLLEIEFKQQQQQRQQRQQKYRDVNKTLPPVLLRLPSKSAIDAFKSVVSAVKRLPFSSSAASPEKTRIKNSIRNLSNKILKKTRFWKRKSNRKEIQRWKSFDELLKDDSEPSVTAGGSMTAVDFTAPEECPGGNSCSDRNLNPPVKNDVVGPPKTDTLQNGVVSTKYEELKQEERQQLSPVSVLDCPFNDDDDDEEVSSPFLNTLTIMEVTKKKHKKKINKFEPVNLSERFALVQETNNGLDGSSPPLLSFTNTKQEGDNNQIERKALDLLNQMKDTLPSYGIKVKADKLLDFFREKIIITYNSQHKQQGGYSFDEELLEEVEHWINGRKSHEAFLEWELPRNREVYVRDMEKGEWKSSDRGNKEIGLELEGEVFGALLSELLVDFSSTATM